MAVRNLNLNATLRLNSKGFQNGLTQAMRQLENFRRDFLSVAGALGASIGIGGLVSSLKDTATSLSVARATLKNTSDGWKEYGENLEWIDGLSKKYKQDIIVLTDSFAKFHAASQGTNFGLAEQKELYEGLTQAATYFHMSSERTENMMIAVEQMMSKGKITAEELRRQLGNNLPGAYAKVAQAAINFGRTTEGAAYSGIKSFADFESAMKKGQIGVDVLLQFVRELNQTTKDFDTHSLQLSMNELKNAWTEFVDSTEVEQALSGLYSMLTRMLKWITNNLGGLEVAISGLAVGTIAGKLIPAIVNIGKAIKGLSWGSWVGIAVAGVTTLIGSIVKLNEKLNETSRKLKEIHGIEDKTERLYQLQKTHQEYSEYVEANKGKYRGMTRDQYMSENYGIGKNGKLISTPTMKEALEIDKYYDYLSALPQIRQEIKEIQDSIPGGNDMHPDASDKGVVTPDTGGTGGGGGGSKVKKDKTVSDVLKAYSDDVNKLKNQLKEGSKTTEEASDELDKLSIKAWENVTEFENLRTELDKLPPELREVADGLEGAFYTAKANAKEAEKQAKIKAQTEKIAAKWKEFNDNRADRAADFSTRSTRFDYRNSSSDILRAEAEQWQKVADDLKKDSDFLKKNFDDLGSEAKVKLDEINQALATATQHVTNLNDAADLEEWKAEIAELSEELDKGIAKAFTSTAKDIVSVVNGAERIAKVFDDEDASGWKKFATVLTEIINIFETINGLVETFNTLTKISEALTKAKGATELKELSKTMAGQTAVNVAKGEGIAITEAATVAEGGEAAAALASTSAKSGEAIAGATKSGASLPFPYNLVAIAAGIAAVVGALALIGKFAGGGIVGGNSRHGDRMLAAVNSGEMVLNSTQQAKLWNMVNGKSTPSGVGAGQVEFKIRGADLVGTIQNYNQRRRG